MITIEEFLTNHVYRTVLIGTVLIGLVSGAFGAFAYLKKQSLISDVVSHSALPGTLAAFLISVTIFQIDGRNIAILMLGAILVGLLASWLTNQITKHSKLGLDSSMAVVLTLFFGIGMLLLRVITNGAFPGKGGIQDYLFGNASVMTSADILTIAITSAAAIILLLLFWKEFSFRTFDSDSATLAGFGPRFLDSLLFLLIVLAVVIGVKAVGLVLMVAFMVTPPAAARQWTNSLPAMVTLSAVFGAVGSAVGSYLSIAIGKLATGPVIVLVLFAIFLASILLSPKRSVLVKFFRQRQAKQRLLSRLSHSEVEVSKSAAPTLGEGLK